MHKKADARKLNEKIDGNSGNMHKILFATVVTAGLSACAMGPDYERPTTEAPAAYKEVDGWKQAQPQAAISRGEWWSVYDDAKLNELMLQLNNGNQDIRVAEARYRQSRALVRRRVRISCRR